MKQLEYPKINSFIIKEHIPAKGTTYYTGSVIIEYKRFFNLFVKAEKRYLKGSNNFANYLSSSPAYELSYYYDIGKLTEALNVQAKAEIDRYLKHKIVKVKEWRISV